MTRVEGPSARDLRGRGGSGHVNLLEVWHRLLRRPREEKRTLVRFYSPSTHTARAPASPMSVTPTIDETPTTTAMRAAITTSARLGSDDRASRRCWTTWMTATISRAIA